MFCFSSFSANMSRSVSRSYCGSEISESDYYSPYSFYGGSEAGTDVTGNDFADSWGGATVCIPHNSTTNLLNFFGSLSYEVSAVARSKSIKCNWQSVTQLSICLQPTNIFVYFSLLTFPLDKCFFFLLLRFYSTRSSRIVQ